MKKFVTTLVLALVATGAQAKTLNIGIDKSGSNPLLAHANFASMAAAYAQNRIREFSDGDKVVLSTLGDPREPGNMLTSTLLIDRGNRAPKVARLVASYIANIPGQTQQAQGSTHLLRWLEFNSFACKHDAEILVITDGIEASSQVSPQALIDGKATLPAPRTDLTGCTLTFYGLGAGLPDQQALNVIDQWRGWAEQAGAQFDMVAK